MKISVYNKIRTEGDMESFMEQKLHFILPKTFVYCSLVIKSEHYQQRERI